MKRVVVHIDRLVLRGVRPEDRHAFAAGLRAELAGALAEPEIATRLGSGGAIANLRVGKVPAAAGTRSAAIGAGVGRRIGQAIRS